MVALIVKKSRLLIMSVLILCFVLAAILLSQNYLDFFLKWLSSEASNGSFKREIGTNFDLWKNGYLGIFFRFKWFGFLSWLTIPFFIYFLATIRRRNRWQIAVFISLITSIIFISVMGYTNSRYQLTIIPVLMPLIFLFSWDLFVKNKKKTSVCLLLLTIIIVSFAVYSETDRYKYYFNAGVGHGRPGTRFPYKLIQYINEEVDDNSVVREANLPLLYYHTDKKSKLPDKPGNRYVLLRGRSENMMRHHELVFEDQGYKLYKRVEGKKIKQKKMLFFLKREKPDFETDFARLSSTDEISIENISRVLPPMKVLGIRNSFFFKSTDTKDKSAIRVKLKKTDFNTRGVLMFGYSNIRQDLGLKIEGGAILYAVVSIKQSPLRRKRVQVFIQDKTDYWVREKTVYAGKSWRDVMVEKKIRANVKKISVGVYWEPGNEKEWIEIKSIQIFIINPLESGLNHD